MNIVDLIVLKTKLLKGLLKKKSILKKKIIRIILNRDLVLFLELNSSVIAWLIVL